MGYVSGLQCKGYECDGPRTHPLRLHPRGNTQGGFHQAGGPRGTRARGFAFTRVRAPRTHTNKHACFPPPTPPLPPIHRSKPCWAPKSSSRPSNPLFSPRLTLSTKLWFVSSSASVQLAVPPSLFLCVGGCARMAGAAGRLPPGRVQVLVAHFDALQQGKLPRQQHQHVLQCSLLQP